MLFLLGQHDRAVRGRQRTDRRPDRGKNEMKNLTDGSDRDASNSANINNRLDYVD